VTEKGRAKTVKKPAQNFKLLLSVPATAMSHLPFQPRVLAAIHQAAEGYEYDLDVGPADENGWQFVVDQFNRVAERVVAEGYDYVLIVESDVFIPENTLQHLLSLNVDVAAGVVPHHSYPDHAVLHECHKNLVCVARFRQPPEYWFTSLTKQDVKDKIITFKDEPELSASTGYLLIKRCVFERGIRFINALEQASYDLIFWRDVANAGFSGAADGFVWCEHLGT
jgi:hypothetical protein